MMDLQRQIITLFTSYVFGLFFSFFLSCNYRLIYESKKWIRLIGTFLIVVLTVFSYFLLLQKVNHGILHPYAIIVIFCGILTEHYLERFIRPYIVRNRKK